MTTVTQTTTHPWFWMVTVVTRVRQETYTCATDDFGALRRVDFIALASTLRD